MELGNFNEVLFIFSGYSVQCFIKINMLSLTDLREEKGGEDAKRSTRKYICIYTQPMDINNMW